MPSTSVNGSGGAVDPVARHDADAAPPAPPHTGEPVAAFARGLVLGIAGAVAALLLATSGRIGYFGDELYFLAVGTHHLEWGYADQPWLLPVLARAMDALVPGSVVALRLPATIVTALGVVLAALLAREFGGARRAQVLAAAAYAISFQLLGSGHILATSTIDPFLWTLVVWLVVRWVRTRADRLLLLAGLATAVAMQAKFLIMFLWFALGVAILITGPRQLLRRPALWAGALCTVVATAPTLVWQARHDWPFLDMQAVVTEQVNRFMGGPIAFVPLAIVFAGLLVGAFLVCHGLWQLLRSPELRAHRFLGWATVLVTAIFVLTVGRYYYLAGLYGPLFAASATHIERVRPLRWWRWVPTWPVFVVSAVVAIFLALPMRPTATVTSTDFVSSGSLGWPQLADTVASSYHRLPAERQRHTAVVTETYWQAGALDVYGLERGLPRVHSPERGYWYLGAPPEEATTVLFVGSSEGQLAHSFVDIRQIATNRIEAKPDNVNQGVPVWLCTGQRAPWPQLWDRMHRF